jgi:hypothetical protein
MKSAQRAFYDTLNYYRRHSMLPEREIRQRAQEAAQAVLDERERARRKVSA